MEKYYTAVIETIVFVVIADSNEPPLSDRIAFLA